MKHWYKFWCKIFGSILLIRLGVVLQETIFSRYYWTIGDDKKWHIEPIHPVKSDVEKTKKKTKNPIGFNTNRTEG